MADVSTGIDPGYGGYANTNRLLAAANNGPDSMNKLLGAARQGQELQQGQVALSQQQFDLAHKQLGALDDVISSVVARPTVNNALDRINDGVRAGVIRPEDAQRESTLITKAGGDPKTWDQPNPAVLQIASDHSQKLIDVRQRFSQQYGEPSTLNTGGQVQGVRVMTGANAGTYPSGPSFTTTQDPNAAANMVIIRDANNVEHQMTSAQAQGAVGYQPPQPTNALGPYTLPASKRGPPSFSGGIPHVHEAEPVQAGDTLNHPIGGSPTTAGPGYGRTAAGVPQAVDGRGRAIGPNGLPNVAPANAPNVDQSGPSPLPGIAGPSPMLASGREDYRNDLNNSSAKLQGMQPLLNALPLIEKLGATGSGPGTKPWQDLKSLLVSQGVISADATDVDVRDEANKYLKQYVSRSAIAQRSDMGTLVSEQSSPNLETSNKATQALARNSIAMDRMEAARPLAYQSDDLSGYSKHKATWTQGQDIRAYQLDVMPSDQRAALVRDMSAKRNTPEGQKFFASLRNAMTAKVLNLPAGAGANQ